MRDFSDTVCVASIRRFERRNDHIFLSLRTVRKYPWCFNVTVAFVGVKRVESVDLRNDLVPRDLDLDFRWTVERLDFADGVARLGVRESDMHHDTYPVRHSIECRNVIVKKKLAILPTLGRFLY